MALLEAIHKRRAIRSFKDRPVDLATLAALIAAATLAPSAMNLQPWAFRCCTIGARSSACPTPPRRIRRG